MNRLTFLNCISKEWHNHHGDKGHSWLHSPQELTSAHEQETSERIPEHGVRLRHPPPTHPAQQRTRQAAPELWHGTTETSLSTRLWFHWPPQSVMVAPQTMQEEEGWEKTVVNAIMLPTHAVKDPTWYQVTSSHEVKAGRYRLNPPLSCRQWMEDNTVHSMWLWLGFRKESLIWM